LSCLVQIVAKAPNLYRLEPTDIILLKLIQIFSKLFYQYLVSCQYSIGHWYQYSKICLLIF